MGVSSDFLSIKLGYTNVSRFVRFHLFLTAGYMELLDTAACVTVSEFFKMLEVRMFVDTQFLVDRLCEKE